MKPGLCARAAALTAAVSLWVSPAMAEITRLDQISEVQGAEIFCLHDELLSESEPFYLVVQAFLYGKEVVEAEAAETKAVEACATAFKWDAAKRKLGVRAGVASATVNYLIEELYAEGAKDEHIQALEKVMRKLPQKDANRFLDDSWLEDPEFIQRINTRLVAEKFPDDAYMLESGRLAIEAYMTMTESTWDWVRTYINKE
jgi:hypothetical protein